MQKSSFHSTLAKVLSVIIASYFLSSCGDNDKVLPDEAYFPLTVGLVWIYDVEESAISRAACADDGITAANYELKVEITEQYNTVGNEMSFLFQRSKRSKPTDPWAPFQSWSARLSGTKLIVNQNNINYVKMNFPLTTSGSWNGNEYNTESQIDGSKVDLYSLIALHTLYSISTELKFDRTITVLQSSLDDILFRDSRKEIYAYGVGLIYKESTELSYFKNNADPCFGQKRTKQGSIYKQTIKQFIKP